MSCAWKLVAGSLNIYALFQREPELGVMQEGVGVCLLVGAGWGEESVQALTVLGARGHRRQLCCLAL